MTPSAADLPLISQYVARVERADGFVFFQATGPLAIIMQALGQALMLWTGDSDPSRYGAPRITLERR